MADSILRLKVDSQEYDQKIKRAAEGIQQYAQKCREAGGTLQYLDDGVLEFVQALGKMDTVATGTKQQLREMSNALTTLTQTYRGLTDEEKASPFGQELAKGIQQLTERAGQAQDAMADVQASIRNAASDTRLFDQMAQGMSVATAGFQGLTGAGKLLGIEMGNDVEVIAKLQAAMAVTNSLTTIQTALQKQSALMQGVQAAQTALATAAQTAFGAATGSATAAQAAFNAVANMNPYVALATAIAAVGTALWAFSSASSEAKKREEELEKAEEEATKKAQEQRDAFVNASASAMNTASRISSLQVAYKQANTEMEKTGILKQAQSEFKKLGIECKGVYDAQTLLLKEGGKIIEMIRLQGNVAAISAMRMEAFKESFKKMMENGYSASTAAILAGANQQVVDLDNQINKMQGRIQGLKGSLGVGGNGGGSGTGGSVNDEDTNYAADSIMAQEKEVAKLTDAWKRASEEMRGGILKDLDAAKAKLTDMQNANKAADGGNIGDIVVKGSIVKSIENDFRNAATNLDAVNAYMNGIKTAMKDADLGTDLYNNLTEKMKDATTMSTLLQNLMEQGINGAELTEISEQLKTALLNGDIPDEVIQEFIENFNKKVEENGGLKLKVNPTTGEVSTDDGGKGKGKAEESEAEKEYKKFESKANQFISGLSSVSSGLKGLGVEIPEEVDLLVNTMQSIMSVIQGVHSIIQVFSTSAMASNTLAINANTVAQYANAVTPFAGGGIVPAFAHGGLIGRAAMGLSIPGNSFSGDNLRLPVDGGRGMIGVNSGELILNRVQQGVLASALDSPMVGGDPQTRLAGEDIFIALNNYTSRAGYGEIVTSNR